MRRFVVAAIASGALFGGPAAAQQRPALDITLRAAEAPQVALAVRELLDDRVLGALQSGFPLYVEYRVALREDRGLFDRTVDDAWWEHVVLHDPVRDVFAVEDPDGRQEIGARDDLARWLARVYVWGVPADRPGRYYYQASIEARTLSDDDVDEAFAWLRGRGDDSVGIRQPGPLTRAARRLLVRVMPLPRISLEGRTESFVVR